MYLRNRFSTLQKVNFALVIKALKIITSLMTVTIGRTKSELWENYEKNHYFTFSICKAHSVIFYWTNTSDTYVITFVTSPEPRIQ